MVLSDRSIKEQMLAGRIRIEPCDPDDIQPSSVDLHLGTAFQVFRNSRYPYIDPSREQPRSFYILPEPGPVKGDPPGRSVRVRVFSDEPERDLLDRIGCGCHRRGRLQPDGGDREPPDR